MVSVFQNMRVRCIKVTISYLGVQEAPEYLELCIGLVAHDRKWGFRMRNYLLLLEILREGNGAQNIFKAPLYGTC